MPKAEACFRAAVAADPKSAVAHARLSQAIGEPYRTREAIEHMRMAASLAPESGPVLESLARLLKRAGHFEEAAVLYQRALDLDGNSATALSGLVNCKKIGPEDWPLLERLKVMSNDLRRPPRQRKSDHFAVAKALDALGDYKAAMAQFDQANSIGLGLSREAGRSFDAKHLRTQGETTRRRFNAQVIAQSDSLGSDSELPVFIVGMIRSGTTLLDQILSSHPLIASAGEPGFWRDETPPGFELELSAGRAGKAQAEQICSKYISMLTRLGSGMSRVLDKMPINYMFLGTIHLLFPRAAIIHCRRSPIDTGLSIYTTEFGEPPPDFAFSRANIVFAYREYLKMMEHWRAIIPRDRMLEVDYESLVRDREGVARKALEFIGVPWDDACLHHETNETFVATPSIWQVRQPIYQSSVERWRRYEPWLGELRGLVG